MTSLLALDQGTTSSRAIVYDEAGRETGRAQHEFQQHFPGPGQVEHDADEIFETQWRSAEEAHQAAGRPEICAVGITNQRETVVVFDRETGRPIHKAIVWQDRRTTGRLKEMAEHADRVRALTGLPLDPYFSASKISWILDEVPGARAAAERGELGACTVDAWLLYRLTGGEVFATEPSNASRTSLYDLRAGSWSDELLGLFGVPRACLPEIRPTASRFGEVAATGWPVTAMIGDQQSALFGQGCLSPGEAKCTYGTGAFLLCNCGADVPTPEHGLLATVAWQIGQQVTFALEGSVLVSGALVQWVRAGLGSVSSAPEIEQLARTVDDAGGVVLVPAFTGLGTPHWDPEARGLIVGLTRGTGRGHLARAALEAMALQVREVQLAMESAGRPFAELRVDGGAAGNDLLMELQATVSGVPVRRPDDLESTALGAMRMARVGAGLAQDAQAGGGRRFDPSGSVADGEALWRRWKSAVDRSRGWAGV